MLKNPNILERVHEEMDRVIRRDGRSQESDIPRLPYQQVVCRETFLLNPPLMLPWISTCSCRVNGYFLPKKTSLG
ncbi:hypothetical protein NL676_004516 [Syzygium grande]|nr:hypothetical protein NL676_004516 [Syzygium grande]